MGRDRNPAWRSAAVPEAMVKEFSTRAWHIDAETDRLIGQVRRRCRAGLLVARRRS